MLLPKDRLSLLASFLDLRVPSTHSSPPTPSSRLFVAGLKGVSMYSLVTRSPSGLGDCKLTSVVVVVVVAVVVVDMVVVFDVVDELSLDVLRMESTRGALLTLLKLLPMVEVALLPMSR